MSREDNLHAFSGPEHYLHFTEKKQQKIRTNECAFSVKYTYAYIYISLNNFYLLKPLIKKF
jgi:hypothetical protein